MRRRRLLLTLLLAVACFLNGGTVWAQSERPAVFVSNHVGDSVTSFTLNNDGSLNWIGQYAAGDGPQCISLSLDGRFIAVGHGTAANDFEELIIFEVQNDASLVHRLTTLTPDSPLDCQWVSPTILAVCKTDLSDDNYVIMYEWDDLANTLTQVDMAFTGTFCTSLAFSMERSLLFANTSLGTDTVFSFSFDAGGMLTLNDAEVTDPIFPLGLGASPDGQSVYACGGISGTGNEILAFNVDPSGALVPIAGIQSPGDSPKVIAVSGDGTVVFAGHGSDSTVQSFMRDPKSGLLSQTGFMFDVGTQGNLGDIYAMDDYLFVTDESTTDNGVRGLYSFRINANGSLTQLGPIVDTQGSRPEYIAAWPGLGPDIVTPDSFTITRGNLTAGGLIELQESDNIDLAIQRNLQDLQSVCEFEIKSISPAIDPSQFDFTLEASVFARSQVTQTIELFNYDTGAYELVDTRNATRFNDSIAVVENAGDLSRFIDAASGCIEARIRFASAVQRQQFAANIDLVSWTIDGSGQ